MSGTMARAIHLQPSKLREVDFKLTVGNLSFSARVSQETSFSEAQAKAFEQAGAKVVQLFNKEYQTYEFFGVVSPEGAAFFGDEKKIRQALAAMDLSGFGDPSLVHSMIEQAISERSDAAHFYAKNSQGNDAIPIYKVNNQVIFPNGDELPVAPGLDNFTWSGSNSTANPTTIDELLGRVPANTIARPNFDSQKPSPEPINFQEKAAEAHAGNRTAKVELSSSEIMLFGYTTNDLSQPVSTEASVSQADQKSPEIKIAPVIVTPVDSHSFSVSATVQYAPFAANDNFAPTSNGPTPQVPVPRSEFTAIALIAQSIATNDNYQHRPVDQQTQHFVDSRPAILSSSDLRLRTENNSPKLLAYEVVFSIVPRLLQASSSDVANDNSIGFSVRLVSTQTSVNLVNITSRKGADLYNVSQPRSKHVLSSQKHDVADSIPQSLGSNSKRFNSSNLDPRAIDITSQKIASKLQRSSKLEKPDKSKSSKFSRFKIACESLQKVHKKTKNLKEKKSFDKIVSEKNKTRKVATKRSATEKRVKVIDLDKSRSKVKKNQKPKSIRVAERSKIEAATTPKIKTTSRRSSTQRLPSNVIPITRKTNSRKQNKRQRKMPKGLYRELVGLFRQKRRRINGTALVGSLG